MNIVFLGDADSFWMKEYINQIFEKNGPDIIIVTNRNNKFRKLYEEIGIKVYVIPKKKRITNLVSTYKVNKNVSLISKKIGAIDIFHVQYVDFKLLLSCKKLLKKSQKIIFTFWGSDLLRAYFKHIIVIRLFMKYASVITVMNKSMKEEFIKKFGNKYLPKIKIIDFGNSVYDEIDFVQLSMDKDSCKRYWGLDERKIIIHVGYNATPEQQHIEIMKEMKRLSGRVLENSVFVFHFGYGMYTEDYEKQLREILEGDNIQYKIINSFLDKKEIAILRLSADVFIYGQTTDALSGSVLEYVYAGSISVIPRWLDYSELKERDIYFEEYGEFKELPDILNLIVQSKGCYEKLNVKTNRNKLHGMSGDRFIEWR